MEIRNYRPTMRYRPFGARTNVLVSMLGIGAMRLPLTPEGVVDETRATELIETGLEGGINYIDTAYVYNDGASEQIIGDMLQRLTNHVYPSTTHRVTNPPRDEARKPRYSTPFFLHHPDFLIDVLPQTVTADNPNRYPDPITAHDYLLERLREIKLA